MSVQFNFTNMKISCSKPRDQNTRPPNSQENIHICQTSPGVYPHDKCCFQAAGSSKLFLKKLSVQGSGTSTALRLYGTYFHQTLLTVSLHRAKGQTSRHFLSNMTSNRIITCEEHKLREQCQKDQTGAAKPEMSFYWNTISWSTWGHILKLSANTLKANLKNSGK